MAKVYRPKISPVFPKSAEFVQPPLEYTEKKKDGVVTYEPKERRGKIDFHAEPPFTEGSAVTSASTLSALVSFLTVFQELSGELAGATSHTPIPFQGSRWMSYPLVIDIGSASAVNFVSKLLAGEVEFPGSSAADNLSLFNSWGSSAIAEFMKVLAHDAACRLTDAGSAAYVSPRYTPWFIGPMTLRGYVESSTHNTYVVDGPGETEYPVRAPSGPADFCNRAFGGTLPIGSSAGTSGYVVPPFSDPPFSGYPSPPDGGLAKCVPSRYPWLVVSRELACIATTRVVLIRHPPKLTLVGRGGCVYEWSDGRDPDGAVYCGGLFYSHADRPGGEGPDYRHYTDPSSSKASHYTGTARVPSKVLVYHGDASRLSGLPETVRIRSYLKVYAATSRDPTSSADGVEDFATAYVAVQFAPDPKEPAVGGKLAWKLDGLSALVETAKRLVTGEKGVRGTIMSSLPGPLAVTPHAATGTPGDDDYVPDHWTVAAGPHLDSTFEISDTLEVGAFAFVPAGFFSASALDSSK